MSLFNKDNYVKRLKVLRLRARYHVCSDKSCSFSRHLGMTQHTSLILIYNPVMTHPLEKNI